MLSTSGAGWPLEFAFILGDVTATEVKWERSVTFWKEVVKNTAPKVGSGWETALEMLSMGDVFLMPAGSVSTASRYIWRGAPIAYVPVNLTSGSLNGMAIAKDPPHPNAAKLLVDFLTSEEGAPIYSEMLGSVSLNPRVANVARCNRDMAKAGIKWSPLPTEFQPDEWVKIAEDTWRKILGR